MNRIRQIDPARSNDKTRQLFEAVQAKLGFVPNLLQVLGNSSASLEGYLGMSSALAGGVLSTRLREQIALAVAEMNDCSYCLSAHTVFGSKTGLTPDEILFARRVGATDEKSDVMLKLARAITLQRGHLADGDLEAAHKGGITHEEIIEMVAHVALNILTNYTNNAARTIIDFPVVVPGELGPTTTGDR